MPCAGWNRSASPPLQREAGPPRQVASKTIGPCREPLMATLPGTGGPEMPAPEESEVGWSPGAGPSKSMTEVDTMAVATAATSVWSMPRTLAKKLETVSRVVTLTALIGLPPRVKVRLGTSQRPNSMSGLLSDPGRFRSAYCRAAERAWPWEGRSSTAASTAESAAFCSSRLVQ